MNDSFELYKPVKLLENIDDYALRKGLIGTIIYVYKKDKVYEAEFTTQDGTVLDIVTLEAYQVEVLVDRDFEFIKEIKLLVSDEQ